jgi:hypothetical protein
MTTAVREPRVRRAQPRVGGLRGPAYVAASQRRADLRVRRGALLHHGPWRMRDRKIVLAGCAVGLVGLGICSWGGSGEVDLSDQLHWLVGGILCVALSAACLAYWLLSGLRTVRLEMARVFATVTPNRVPTGVPAGRAALVTVAGMVRYHRPECPLVAGKTVRELDAATIAAEGLRECGACG